MYLRMIYEEIRREESIIPSWPMRRLRLFCLTSDGIGIPILKMY